MQLDALTFAADSIYLRLGLHKRFEGREGGGTRDLACLSGDAVQGMLSKRLGTSYWFGAHDQVESE